MDEAEKHLIARLTALVEQAQPLLDAHDNEPAQALVNRALALDPGCNLQHSANVMVRVQASKLALRRGDNEQSARHNFAALALANALGDAHMLAYAHLVVAGTAVVVGDIDYGLAKLEASWPHVRDGDDQVLRFWYQTNIGAAMSDLDQAVESKEWLLRADATAQALGTPRLMALGTSHLSMAWLNLGDSAHARGDHAAAEAAWRAAVAVADEALPRIEQSGMRLWYLRCVHNRWLALGALGQVDEALAGLAELVRQAQASGLADLEARVQYGMAMILYRSGRLAEAMAALKVSREVGEACQAHGMLPGVHELTSKVAEQMGDLAQALAAARRHHAMHVAAANDRAAMRSKLLAVQLETERAQAEAAAERQRRIALAETNLALEKRALSLHHEAHHDTLTALPNRRQLDHALAIAHADARLNHKRLFLALLDIDHFKAINDQHSHMVGDRVLQQLGSLLSAASRNGDLAARYGGEEFVVVMGDVTPNQAVAVAERMRLSIQAFDWAGVAPGLRVTASFGVCNIAPSADPVSGLLMADKLLYEAKQRGRNQVVCAPAPAH